MTTWIDIKKKLPPDDCWFLVTDGKYFEVRTTNQLHIDAETKRHRTPARHGEGMNVDYWMLIPKPPSKRKK